MMVSPAKTNWKLAVKEFMNQNITEKEKIIKQMRCLQKELSIAAFASNNGDVEICMNKIVTVRKALNAI